MVSEPNYDTENVFPDLLTIEIKKQTFMNKPVYLHLPILEIGKTIMCEFWYD